MLNIWDRLVVKKILTKRLRYGNIRFVAREVSGYESLKRYLTFNI
ncbi:hypothetical protein [Caloranaerobacter azorensis]|nr:hypothetical protein [Caloranaerobacter azorensis]